MARLLLDECVPKRLARLLAEHDVATVNEMRWTSAPDRNLLQRAAAEGFDAVVTVDRSLPFQQRTAGLPLAIIVLRARSNRYGDLAGLVPKLLEAVARVRPGEVVTLTENA